MKDTTQDMTEGMVLENAEASRDAGDEAARLEKEMQSILVVAAITILVVLFLTSRTYG